MMNKCILCHLLVKIINKSIRTLMERDKDNNMLKKKVIGSE